MFFFLPDCNRTKKNKNLKKYQYVFKILSVSDQEMKYIQNTVVFASKFWV